MNSQQHGYDVNFVSAAPDCLRCSVCHFVLRNPLLVLTCGHRFCKPCFNRRKDHSTPTALPLLCPIDQQAIDDTKVVEDSGVQRAINSLVVECGPGCTWVGELSDLGAHQEQCSHRKQQPQLSELLKVIADLQTRVDSCESRLLCKDEEKEAYESSLREIEMDRAKRMAELKDENDALQGRIVKLTSENKSLINAMKVELDLVKEAQQEFRLLHSDTGKQLEVMKEQNKVECIERVKDLKKESQDQTTKFSEESNRLKEAQQELEMSNRNTNKRLNEIKEQKFSEILSDLRQGNKDTLNEIRKELADVKVMQMKSKTHGIDGEEQLVKMKEHNEVVLDEIMDGLKKDNHDIKIELTAVKKAQNDFNGASQLTADEMLWLKRMMKIYKSNMTTSSGEGKATAEKSVAITRIFHKPKPWVDVFKVYDGSSEDVAISPGNVVDFGAPCLLAAPSLTVSQGKRVYFEVTFSERWGGFKFAIGFAEGEIEVTESFLDKFYPPDKSSYNCKKYRDVWWYDVIDRNCYKDYKNCSPYFSRHDEQYFGGHWDKYSEFVIGVSISMISGTVAYSFNGDWDHPQGDTEVSLYRTRQYFPVFFGSNVKIKVNFGDSGEDFKYKPFFKDSMTFYSDDFLSF